MPEMSFSLEERTDSTSVPEIRWSVVPALVEGVDAVRPGRIGDLGRHPAAHNVHQVRDLGS